MTGFFMIIAAAGWYLAALLWRRLSATAQALDLRRQSCERFCPLAEQPLCPSEADHIARDLATGDRQGRAVETGDPARNSSVAKPEVVPARSANHQH